MKFTAVSTFPASHADIYGEQFLAECEIWQIPLTIVHYEDFNEIPCHGEDRIDARMGEPKEDIELWQWRRRAAHLPNTAHYRFQAARFAWKAFAMTRPDIQDGVDFLVWLDADVRIHAAPDWDALLSYDHDVSYLGRSQWDHSETGFLAWNLQKRGAEGLAAIREFYTSGWLLAEPQWHDAWIFDRIRERLQLNGLNLSPEAKGLDAWQASPLAKWSMHMKGNRKFHDTAHAASA